MFRLESIKKYVYLVLMVALVAICSCTQIHYSTDPDARLYFSCDTLTFDTIFTEVPSRTSSILVYNQSNDYLNISEIRLREGAGSSFRFNFNGKIPNEDNELKNLEIAPHDSLYVFVELTAPENEDNLPVYIEDELLFTVNGNTNGVLLNAYGQQAITFRTHSFASDTTLTKDHCYLVFGYLHIPEGTTLTITEGTTIYFHRDAHLIADGNIVASGTSAEPIVMRGDRFDHINDVDHTPYDYMPAQWGNIYLQNSTSHYCFTHTHIRGGSLGIMLIGASRSNPTLQMESCIVHNNSGYGLYIQEGVAELSNCEFSNCGVSCLTQLGGELQATHCTFANYYPWGMREGPAVAITNYVLNGNRLTAFPISRCVMENSIIFGSIGTELELDRDTFTNANYNVYISDCLIKAKQSTLPYYNNITWSHNQNDLIPGTTLYESDTVFVNTSIANRDEDGYFNFQLAIGSRALNRANKSVSARYPTDLNGNNRLTDGHPDLGAYERMLPNQ